MARGIPADPNRSRALILTYKGRYGMTYDRYNIKDTSAAEKLELPTTTPDRVVAIQSKGYNGHLQVDDGSEVHFEDGPKTDIGHKHITVIHFDEGPPE
jgi:hypothetical protein